MLKVNIYKIWKDQWCCNSSRATELGEDEGPFLVKCGRLSEKAVEERILGKH